MGWLFDSANLGVLAGLLSTIAFIPYILSILKGETRPNRATWFIWTIVGGIIAGSYYQLGARHTLWVAVGYFLGPAVVAMMAIRRGEGGWSRLDQFCLGAAGVSLIIWATTGSPLLALVMNIFIDMFGVLPTAKKSYFEPESESRMAWAMASVGNLFNLLAVDDWSKFDIAAYPVHMMAANGLITIFVWFSPWRGAKSPTQAGKPHFGEHLTLDGYGGSPQLLDQRDRILDCIYDLADQLEMTMLAEPRIYRAPDNQIKDPGGWSAFVVIAESHISIHTFPARRFVSADIYTCRAGLPKDRVIECLTWAFGLKDTEVNFLIRGTRYPAKNLAPEYGCLSR